MLLNKTLCSEGLYIRVLEEKGDMWLVMDCQSFHMPQWHPQTQYQAYKEKKFDYEMPTLTPEETALARQRFTLISFVLPVIGDEKKRCQRITEAAETAGVTKQTIRKYLCRYLVYFDVDMLAVKKTAHADKMTKDCKNMSWALNKYYYTQKKYTLMTAYRYMLSERYCNEAGKLEEVHPSFYQFRYYYRTHKKVQNHIIAREGIKAYQKNHRPCLGDGVQEYAPCIGTGMLDATICDIYLVNDTGFIVGRPILTACVDACSGLCCGYTLTWEGGTYSLRSLMLHVLTDKKKYCESFGISIDESIWPCKELPGKLVTDMGKEYTSSTFEQLCELGVTIENLPAFRPDLKGPVEKFFDVVQNYYKPLLKGKGVIEPNFQERGAHDYRLDACLTMRQFETILLHCIIFYNSKRVLENFPYTDDMIEEKVAPHSYDIWNWQEKHQMHNLIPITKEELVLCFLPRTNGRFTKQGLMVNKLRYRHPDYTEQYLTGGDAICAYNPDNVSSVWLMDKGRYLPFQLIESRYENLTLEKVTQMKAKQRQYLDQANQQKISAEIELMNHIQAVADFPKKQKDFNIQEIRQTRDREKFITHKDCCVEVTKNE